MKKIVMSALAIVTGSVSYSYEIKGQLKLRPDNSAECSDLIEFATQGKVDPYYKSSTRSNLDPFRTDGLIIQKDGQKVLEWYDGVVNEDTSHVLWSASKMLTATLLARTIYEGTYYPTLNGPQKVTLDTKLKDFFPVPERLKNNPTQKALYEQITLGHLAEMSANFDWKEYYDGDITNSSFLPMLYLNGQKNMAEYAIQAPLNPEGPGHRWNYSGGNANILMAVLAQIHQKPIYEIANELLFKPLGLEHAKIETDQSGHGVGSSYFYMTLNDMIKVGDLYLNKGVNAQGVRLLPESWVQEAQTLNTALFELDPTQKNKKTYSTTLDYIKKLGAPSRRIFWLNQNIVRQDGEFSSNPATGEVVKNKSGQIEKILYPQEMPENPKDMYFAAGHYGQLIIIIPSEKLVIARTGYDLKYWDHIQPLVTKTLKCLKPGYKVAQVKDIVPPSADPKQSLFGKIWSIAQQVPELAKSVNYIRTESLGAAIVAKEMCSFLYTMGAENNLQEDQYITEYYSRSGLPSILLKVITSDLQFNINRSEKTVTANQYGYIVDPTYNESKRVVIKTIKARMLNEHSGCQIISN